MLDSPIATMGRFIISSFHFRFMRVFRVMFILSFVDQPASWFPYDAVEGC